MKPGNITMLDRRVNLLRAVMAVVAFLILYNLFNQSVVQHNQILALAKNQQISRQDIIPRRGNIYAKTNDGLYPLGTTDEKYTISAVPKNIKDKERSAKFLSEKLGIEYNDIFDKINNDKKYIPPLAKHISKDIVTQIKDEKIVGVLTIPDYVRFYPEGSLGSAVLGFVNFENKGNYGIEGFYDEQLRGFGGSVLAEKDNKGRFISIVSQTANSQNGDSLVLTIDQNVQYVAEKYLKESIEKYGATGGQVIIEDVKTGEIVAMASIPNFDPNKFNEVKPEDQGAFLNPNISNVYEPGSILKPIVIALGIDTEKIKPEDEGEFTNMVVVQGYEIHTSQDKSFGKENITQILENSDNVAMVWVGNKIGNDIMFDYFQKFGFGVKTGIDLSGETTGKLLEKKLWRDISRATMTFGQGVSVTPLQMLMSYQVLGNDGKLVAPHLVSKVIRFDGSEKLIETKELRQVIKPETAAIVRKMLVSVVERGHGKKAKIEGYEIGGKTGTAQIPKKEGGGYEENAHIGSFAGLVPADNPRFAMLVKLDRPTNVEFAESSAAPTFGEIAKFLLQYYQIPKKQ